MDEEVNRPYESIDPSTIKFSPALFGWLLMKFIIIDDFPYTRMDLCDDSELKLPEGEQWDASGKIL